MYVNQSSNIWATMMKITREKKTFEKSSGQMFSVPLTLFILCDIFIVAVPAAAFVSKRTQTHSKATLTESYFFVVLNYWWKKSLNSIGIFGKNAFELCVCCTAHLTWKKIRETKLWNQLQWMQIHRNSNDTTCENETKKNQHHDQKERKYCNVHVCTVYDKMYKEAWSLKKSFKKRKSNEILMVFERVYVYIVCLCMRRTQSRNRLLSKRTIECMHIAYSRSSSESRKKNEAKAKDKEEKNEYIK